MRGGGEKSMCAGAGVCGGGMGKGGGGLGMGWGGVLDAGGLHLVSQSGKLQVMMVTHGLLTQ